MTTVQISGEPKTENFAVYFNHRISGDQPHISPWHDIPLLASATEKIFNMVVEIPRGHNAKFEISLSKKDNPIVQDVKNGKLRYIADVNGASGYLVNYGAFPQTWEDPKWIHPDTNCKGDKDPIDVCEIGSAIGTVGQVKRVKVLGCLAMIDEGETDWKVIAIDVEDPLANSLNDVEDIDKEMPGFINKLYEWFRDYKIPDGKPPNNFAFDGKAKNVEYTLKVIQEGHEHWRNTYCIPFAVPNSADKSTTDYRVSFECKRGEEKVKISPWHNLPVVHNFLTTTFNMIVEIPRSTNAKMEICLSEPFNPIKQDVKNGKLRVIADVNGARGYPFNYGAFPQTWEDPTHITEDTGAKGDNDPLDVCEIGSTEFDAGAVTEVKVLGCLAMIDEGETDWKIICISTNDPLASKLNSLEDVEREKPGYMNMMYEWFRDYKIPDGKPANKFAFDGKPKDRSYTLKVIEECNLSWKAKYWQ